MPKVFCILKVSLRWVVPYSTHTASKGWGLKIRSFFNNRMGAMRLALEAFKAGSKVWDWLVRSIGVAWYATLHPRAQRAFQSSRIWNIECFQKSDFKTGIFSSLFQPRNWTCQRYRTWDQPLLWEQQVWPLMHFFWYDKSLFCINIFLLHYKQSLGKFWEAQTDLNHITLTVQVIDCSLGSNPPIKKGHAQMDVVPFEKKMNL